MKLLLTISSIILISFSAIAQTDSKVTNPTSKQVVEASCGQCNFGLTDQKGCDLAVKIDGKAYWVRGTSIDKHGDSHAADGLCSTVRKAEVVGEIIDGKFKASQFRLLPLKVEKPGHKGHNHN